MQEIPDTGISGRTLAEKLIDSAKKGRDFSEVLQLIEETSAPNTNPYNELLLSLCDIDMPEPEAKAYVDHAMYNRSAMEKKLGRTISFQVALLDYIMNNGHKMVCPKIVDLKSFEERTKLIMVDELTGLYNRRYADSLLSKEMDRAKRFNLQLSVLFTDIDNFKQVNDNHGHGIGDEVLKGFSSILNASLRTHDTAARFGGEEFIILMPETGEAGAKIYGERLLERCRSHRFPKSLNVTFSGGIACYPSHGCTPESLLEQADMGLYYSKAKGKNQITILEQKKRNAVRYPTEIEMSYHSKQAGGPAKTKDLSISGLSFMARIPLTVGETVNLHLKFPSATGEMEVGAQIVWIRKADPEKDYFLGAKFCGLKPEVVRLAKNAASVA